MTEDLGGMLELPENFATTAPVYNPNLKRQQCEMYINAQTQLICQILEITNPYSVFLNRSPLGSSQESDLSQGDITFIDSDTSSISFNTNLSALHTSVNPEEISLQNIGEESSSDGEKPHVQPEHKLTLTQPCATSSPMCSTTPQKRLSLSLPQPNKLLLAEEDEPSRFCGSPSSISLTDVATSSPQKEPPLVNVSFDSEVCSSILSCVTDTQESSQTDEESARPKIKKFKRRNLSFYTETEESS